jgi:hypothetical protein
VGKFSRMRKASRPISQGTMGHCPNKIDGPRGAN